MPATRLPRLTEGATHIMSLTTITSGPPITRKSAEVDSPAPRMYLVATPAQREELEAAAQLTADVATVIEAAGMFHLDEVELTEYQRWDLTRILPRPRGVVGGRDQDKQRRIHAVLELVGEELREWHLRDNGVEVDGWQVPEWLADLSLTMAEQVATREIARAQADAAVTV